MSAEQWRPVVGIPGYLVSDLGRVMRANTGRILKYGYVRGYLKAGMSSAGKLYQRLVHRMVLEAFVGPAPAGHQVRHLDGDPKNNRLTNLRWGTPVENASDTLAHGRRARKLDDDQIREVRRLHGEGSTLRALGLRFGVSYQAIHALVTRRHGRHVP